MHKSFLNAAVDRRAVVAGIGATAALSALPARAASLPPLSGPKALPYIVPDKLANAATMVPVSQVRVDGWLGHRVGINARARLTSVDLEPLLAGFRKKPGSHPWIGEHIGKWMHAATLAWASTGDAKLKARLDYAAKALVQAQEPDGYLGTYLPADRLALVKGAGWDVWSHKYCLIGLLTYYQYTGDRTALDASRKAADLLIATFPAKRSILAAGHHSGMAATSVLQPIVQLYRLTADKRYLDFAHYIVKSWQEAGGPDIVRTLMREKRVEAVGNAKAYEMLSNIVGVCELARVTGDRTLIDASINAWNDIAATQLFITGATSDGEFFQPDTHMAEENMARVGETCVTTTWIQLNQALFQMTGEARFGDELERTYYNALTAAQHPDGQDWCYFTALNGRKKYDKDITCCHSSGPRGLALSPLSAYLTGRDGGDDVLMVSTLEPSSARVTLGGQAVLVEQATAFPQAGGSRLRLTLRRPARFRVKVRVPAWAGPVTIAGATVRDGWAHLPPRLWRDGDEIAIGYTLASTLTSGAGYRAGRQWLNWGPFVLAYEHNANGKLPPVDILHYEGPARLTGTDGFLRFEAPVTRGRAPSHHEDLAYQAFTARLVTYADAGADGGYYRIWLRRRAAA